MSKFRNVRTEVNGEKFDSKKEARRFADLKLLERAGEIKALSRQPFYELHVNGVHVCSYIGDFIYHERDSSGTWQFVVEDVKGIKTAIYRLKAKLMKACHGIEIRET